MPLIPGRVHPAYLLFNVVPCRLALLTKLIDVLCFAKIVDRVNFTAIVRRGYHLDIVFRANFHKFTVLDPPLLTEKSVHLAGDYGLYDAFFNIREHSHESGTLV